MLVFTKLLLNRLSQEYWEEGADARRLASDFKTGVEEFKQKLNSHFPVYLEKFGGLDAVAMGIKEAGHSHAFIAETFGVHRLRILSFSRLVREYKPEIGRATWKSAPKFVRGRGNSVRTQEINDAELKSYRCENCTGVYKSIEPKVCPICSFDNTIKKEVKRA